MQLWRTAKSRRFTEGRTNKEGEAQKTLHWWGTELASQLIVMKDRCLFSISNLLQTHIWFYFACVFLPGESHGRRGLVGYSLCGCKESEMTKQLTHTQRELMPYMTHLRTRYDPNQSTCFPKSNKLQCIRMSQCQIAIKVSTCSVSTGYLFCSLAKVKEGMTTQSSILA